jgi:hypothetical protein
VGVVQAGEGLLGQAGGEGTFRIDWGCA